MFWPKLLTISGVSCDTGMSYRDVAVFAPVGSVIPAFCSAEPVMLPSSPPAMFAIPPSIPPGVYEVSSSLDEDEEEEDEEEEERSCRGTSS